MLVIMAQTTLLGQKHRIIQVGKANAVWKFLSFYYSKTEKEWDTVSVVIAAGKVKGFVRNIDDL